MPISITPCPGCQLQVGQLGFTSGFIFSNVTASLLPSVKTLYGADWNASWEALAAAGDLMQMNLTYVDGFR